MLSREQVAQVALRVLDEDGLEALTVERVARELGVRGPSIYHHFAGKSEILVEVARLVLGDLELHREFDTWQDWMVAINLTFYRRVVSHPRSATILVAYLPEISSVPALAYTARLLTRFGVDPALHTLLMEGTEKISWGWALKRAVETNDGGAEDPGDEALLEHALRAFLDGVLLRDRDRQRSVEGEGE